MKISKEQIQLLKKAPNSLYEPLKCEFLFHSNKLEGSNFSKEALAQLIEAKRITGTYSVEDVLETLNSVEVFDFIVDTLGAPITKDFLCKLNSRLFYCTKYEKAGFAGHYKEISNRIRNSSVQLAHPSEVEPAIEALISEWNASKKEFSDVVNFHIRFEGIHPFRDGNGRIGRFIVFKQCIENDIDLVFVDSERGHSYRKALELAQIEGQNEPLYLEFLACQKKLDAKFEANNLANLVPKQQK